MVVSKVRRGRLAEWGLGKHKPPEGLPKNVELIWNQDALRWEVYLLTHKGAISCDDQLTWQMSTPFKRVVTLSEVKNFLQKHDTSEGGSVSLEERKRRWVQMFKDSNDREERRDHLVDVAPHHADLLQDLRLIKVCLWRDGDALFTDTAAINAVPRRHTAY